MFDVGLERQSGVKPQTEVGDNGGERNELTIKGGADVGGLGKLVGGAYQDCLSLAAVELEVVGGHPGADVFQAGVQGLESIGVQI